MVTNCIQALQLKIKIRQLVNLKYISLLVNRNHNITNPLRNRILEYFHIFGCSFRLCLTVCTSSLTSCCSFSGGDNFILHLKMSLEVNFFKMLCRNWFVNHVFITEKMIKYWEKNLCSNKCTVLLLHIFGINYLQWFSMILQRYDYFELKALLKNQKFNWLIWCSNENSTCISQEELCALQTYLTVINAASSSDGRRQKKRWKELLSSAVWKCWRLLQGRYQKM